MKTNTRSIATPVTKEEMTALLKETKETIALKRNGAPVFGALDLWSMQKKKKTLGSSTKW